MAKYSGIIGYCITSETNPGVWEEKWVTRKVYGDLIRNTRQLESANRINDNVRLSNQISFVADPFACQNFHSIRYATYMGTKWEVSMVDVQTPRLVLTLGGVYNGPTEDGTTDDSGENSWKP